MIGNTVYTMGGLWFSYFLCWNIMILESDSDISQWYLTPSYMLVVSKYLKCCHGKEEFEIATDLFQISHIFPHRLGFPHLCAFVHAIPSAWDTFPYLHMANSPQPSTLSSETTSSFSDPPGHLLASPLPVCFQSSHLPFPL